MAAASGAPALAAAAASAAATTLSTLAREAALAARAAASFASSPLPGPNSPDTATAPGPSTQSLGPSEGASPALAPPARHLCGRPPQHLDQGLHPALCAVAQRKGA